MRKVYGTAPEVAGTVGKSGARGAGEGLQAWQSSSPFSMAKADRRPLGSGKHRYTSWSVTCQERGKPRGETYKVSVVKVAAWVPEGLVGIPGKQDDQGCRTGPLMGQTQVLLVCVWVIKIGPLLRDQGRLQSGLLLQVAHFLTSIRINSLWQLLPSLLHSSSCLQSCLTSYYIDKTKFMVKTSPRITRSWGTLL